MNRNKMNDVTTNLIVLHANLSSIKDKIRNTIYGTSDSFAISNLNSIMEELEYNLGELSRIRNICLSEK